MSKDLTNLSTSERIEAKIALAHEQLEARHQVACQYADLDAKRKAIVFSEDDKEYEPAGLVYLERI